jgi:hypothetical protein
MQRTLIGPHTVEAEPDLIHVHWVGLPTLPQLEQIYQVIEGLLRPAEHSLVLFDLRQAAIPSAELRRYAGRWWRRHADTVSLASYGMDRSVGAAVALVARGVQLVSHKPSYSMNHATEAEARAWLAAVAEQRRGRRLGSDR